MNNISSEAILVGIGYGNFLRMDSLRNRDYTFPEALPQDSFALSGGAPRYLNFIRQELAPRIEAMYAVDRNQRTLLGHSLGAYLVLYAMLDEMQQSTTFFRNYVAASPSLHYYHNYLLQKFRELKPDTMRRTLTLGDSLQTKVHTSDMMC